MKKFLLISLAIVLMLTAGAVVTALYQVLSQHHKLAKGTLASKVLCDTIPFYYSPSGHILIDAQINDSEEAYPFILDSGASNMLFSHFTAGKDFDNNGYGIGIGSAENVFVTKIKGIDSLKIGGISFTDLNAKEIDFNFDCQQHVAGIIGTGLMQHLVWQIDFEKQMIIVANSLQQLSLSDNTIEIPLRRNKFSHHLRAAIKLRYNKRPKEVLVDLGSNRTLAIKESLLLSDSIPLLSKRIDGQASKGLGTKVDTTITHHYYLLDSLLFSESSYHVTDVTVGAGSKSLDLLGLGFFTNYRTTISWADNQLILEPYTTQPDFKIITSGMSVQYNGVTQKVEIGTITRDMPAARAGLTVGTQVVSVNGMPLADLDSYCVFKNTSFEGDTIRIKVKEVDDLVTEYVLVKEPVFSHW